MLKLGVRGSALATIVSQTVCSIWILLYFRGNKSFLKLKRKNMKLEKVIVREIISIGISPFVLINSIGMLILTPVFGINQKLK